MTTKDRLPHDETPVPQPQLPPTGDPLTIMLPAFLRRTLGRS